MSTSVPDAPEASRFRPARVAFAEEISTARETLAQGAALMWSTLPAGILTRPWTRRTVLIALAVLTITLFLLNFRRQGERRSRRGMAGHAGARQCHPSPDAGCGGYAVLATATSSLTGCTAVVEYSRAEQARVAKAVAALVEGSAIRLADLCEG